MCADTINSAICIGGGISFAGNRSFNAVVEWDGNNGPQNVGIKKYENELKFKIFPNPSNGEITIETNSEKKLVATVFNSLGQKLFSKNFSSQTKINTSSFAKGIYQVQVCDPEG